MKNCIVYARSSKKEDDIVKQIELAKSFADVCSYNVAMVLADTNVSSVAYPDTSDARIKAKRDKNASKQYRRGLGVLFNMIADTADSSDKIEAVFVDRRTRLFYENKSNSAEYIKKYFKRYNVAVITR